ncbi:hypothetical protein GGQ64_004600 [Rhizobium azooxidifex]|uniref:Uncharacterized protein n=1 Tax=Mycoplana azooxidifex TaxID=1636188 RepID=A0A7W6DA02_9HYPH|nr:hypothetical protein [Mycoplana azooxidifex]MBB3979360.1 hypothetical protein [Mycoplana azooxidifex]
MRALVHLVEPAEGGDIMARAANDATGGWLPDPANWRAALLVVSGLAALLLCVLLAIFSGPKEFTSAECEQAQTTAIRNLADADTANDQAGILRIVDVMPEVTEPGRNICILVAGVVSRETVDERQNNVTTRERALEASEARLEKATTDGKPASEITRPQNAVDKAKADLSTAKAVQTKPLDPVPLSVYLNDNLASFLTVQARATDQVQRLYFPLWTPEDASDAATKFWRELLRGVALSEPFGKRHVDIGLSRVESTASVPETARNGNIGRFTIYVFSPWPVTVGLLSLALLTAAFCAYAARTSLLRDNSLTCRDLPGRIQDAQREEKRRQRELEAAVADLATAPADPDKVAAFTAARSSFDAASAEIGRLETALDVDPVHRSQRVQRMRLDCFLIELQEEVAKRRAAWDAAQSARDAAEKTFDKVSGLTVAQAALDQAEAALADAPPGASTKARDAAAAAKEQLVSINETLMKATEAELEAAGKEMREAVSGLRREQARFDEAARLLADAEKAHGDAELAASAAADKVAEIQRGFPASRFADWAVGPYSLGRTQMAFWLFLVVAGYVFIAMSVGLFYGILTEEILMLIGISGATGLGSVLINAGTAEGLTSRGFTNDVLSVDGAPQLQRIQAVAWTLILGALFVWITARDFRLPAFDPTLLLMMGLVSGFYLGFKFQEGAKGEAPKGDGGKSGGKH